MQGDRSACPGGIRFQERHYQPKSGYPTQAHDGYPTLPGDIACKNVRQWPSKIRHHCLALWSGKNPCGNHCRVHDQEKHAGALYLSVSALRRHFNVSVSVAQWKQQFLQFSNISERQICAFTQGEKEMVTMKRDLGADVSLLDQLVSLYRHIL